MKKMQKEETFKILIDGQEKTIIVKHPSTKIEAEANMHASRIFAKLTAKVASDDEKLLLRTQLDSYLRSVGLYTDDDIKAIADLQIKIDELEKKLSAGGIKKSEGRTIAIDLRKTRYSLLLLLAKRMEYDKYTVEYHSENGRLAYIVSKCLCDESGEPIFDSADDYLYDETGLKDTLAEPIRRIGALSTTYDPDFENKLPENKFLKKYNFCNDEYDLVDKDGNLVDDKGNRIDADGNPLDENGQIIKVEKEIGEFLED